MATSQVSAAQWQSFEMRMRQRKAARLVVRAQAALEHGLVADAAAALDEAQGLDSSTPDLATLMARLPSPAPAADLPLVVAAPFEEPEPVVSQTGHRAPGWIAVAASLAIIGSLAGWGVTRLSPGLLAPSTSSATSPPTTASVTSHEPTAIPEPPIAATTGRADALSAPAALNPTANTVQEVDAPVATVQDLPARVDVDGSPARDAEPAVVPVSRATTTAASVLGDAPPPPEAPRAEAIRELPAPERSIALPEAAAPPPAPVATPTSDISVPAPVVAAPVAPEAAEPPRVDDTPLVRRVLSQYESAYSSLDVSAVKRVWPALDTFALARAFDGLAMQRVSLGDCRVSLNGPTARADCRGSAQWTPKIGGGTRSASRSWSFDLRNTDGQWRIVDVTMR